MTNEKVTDIFIATLLKESGIKYIPNDGITKEVKEALKTASKNQTGKQGFPEFTAQSEEFILVIEDKADLNKHASFENKEKTILSNDPKSVKNFAMNGAVHYAQKIVDQTNFKKVFAFGCSGDEKHHKIRPIFVDAKEYKILPEVENFENFTQENIMNYYNEQVLGKMPEEEKEIMTLCEKSKDLHEFLRNYGQLGETEKPLVVSAILLALNDSENENLLDNLKGRETKTDGEWIFEALGISLKNSEVPFEKTEVILNQFTIIKDRRYLNEIDNRLGKTPLKYFSEFIKDNISDKINSYNSPADVLGKFYGEFMKYSGGDGQTLGIVLTPQHITELFCDLLELNQDDVIFDPCCGTGGFLLAGMHKMIESANNDEKKINNIKKNQIYGIEVREEMFSIATTNMILRGDGKSNLRREDFLKIDPKELQKDKYTVGLMNPPYSQKNNKETAHLSELHFIEHLLDSLNNNARCAVIVPQSTMIGQYNEDKQVKKNILKKHTLEGVITLNSETFYKVGVNPCIAIFTAHNPHQKEKRCKFVNFKDDGFITRKHIGLVKTERVKEKKEHLLKCWQDKKDAETKFMVKTQIEADDEWLHSFYYFNDELPNHEDFEKSIAEYLTFEFDMVMKGKEYLFLNEESL
ncbi:MAG: SAM-dependent methyltransferase [Methanobacteriales archaeon HGW-Methanobacteriales-1]|jgi:type I restriction-modification system DNA methylase subunit|nr:MAG: SAM-dependent methyltransferase [Methanobacteriales archaeon HGW-Methanobacteriales-1]